MGEVKVLHCIHSLSWGGLEIYTVELIQKLAEKGLSQKVLCSAHSRVTEELKKSGVEVLPFPEKKLSKLKTARLIRNIIKEHGITHLHSHTRLDMWACALAKWNLPKIKHIYNLYMNATPKRDFVHKWLFSKVDALCSSSENILEDVKKNFPIAAEKLHLIRYGRKTENFKHDGLKRQELRDKYGARIEQIVFGTLCRIDPGKGVRELVQALEYLNDHELEKTQLWIVGDPTIIGKNPDGTPVFEGPSEELSRWIAERMENPRYKDHIVRIPFQKNYVSYIDALDVFALASYNETYSLSVLDAMMMAKPVIGTNAGGTPEQVGLHHERGVLAEPKDAESLSQAFRHYLQRPEDIQIQGHKAQEWSLSKHNWPVTQEAFLSLYKSI
ncbi:glycosyltransferase family 4 protein [Bdellovibrio bacteriovorus]|uniref:glycosyltransferase family 4 protein n=1 Tax=Bdellovibrio bacteriovorus TaxID=959 RepID=UPI0035A72E64